LVIDGLDECARGEAAKSVKWLLSLANGGLGDPNIKLRIIFSGQRDGVLDMLLASQPSISLEMSGHMEDIQTYCLEFCYRIQAKFKIPSLMREKIMSLVVNEANGRRNKQYTSADILSCF
jgi:hypothetical protein